jgi:hypothetical protein
MPVRHQIKDTDTLEYLSNYYLGAPERWQEIADYNNLIYPYLSKDPEDKYKVYASGFVRVTRETARQPLTIKKNWTVQTKRSVLSATVKTFRIVNDVVIPAGDFEAYIQIRALLPGIQGNASEGTVTELGPDFASNDVSVTIRNDVAIKGGNEGFVRVSGEYVYIPDDTESFLLSDYDTRFSYDHLRYFYGEDLKMEDDDLVLSVSNGDLATVGYTKNVEQAINRRFTSEPGDLLSDFSFGSNISGIIGDNGLPFEAKKRLIQLEILQVLSLEDRISEPVIESIVVVPQELSCYVTLSMKVVKMGTMLQMQNLVLGGMG